MVEDENSFTKVLGYFKLEKTGLLKMKEPLRIVVSGFKEHVAKAVAEIKEKFSQLQTGNDITEAQHENDKKDTKIKGTTSGKIFIEPSSIFAKYVEVHNIPEGLSKKQLILDLFMGGEFPIRPPKLVYNVGSSKALLICHREQDAKELSECTSLVPFKFSSVKGKALSSVTKTIDKKTVEKMKKDGKYDKFKQELENADIQIKGESPFMLVAPSTFQCCYVLSILEELTGTPSAPHLPGSIQDNETVTSEHDGFHKIETIKDVQENVWDILCCSNQLIQIKDKCKDISYDKDTFTVIIGQEVCKDDFKKITAIVGNLRAKEWDEIPLEAQHCNKSKVDRWCDEVKEVMLYECCKYIDGKVLVYAKNYDDIMKIKHLFGVKTGKIKTTGKGKRGGKASSDKDDRQVDTPGSSGAESKSPDRRIDGKNLKKYITKENIYVYVYEANILNLDVDCIVNAANESLQHGGGVAAVIEKGAGYKLKEESRDFVRKYGNLPVGKACTTTAGNLSFDCVIHTVGPRWSAYSPHSMQDVQECQLHLYLAVYNSFLEAEKRGLKSIALPAISSAIFGVPEEICVQQYAKATFDYSRKTSDEPTALKEIHFIDKNSNIVKKIQDAFYLVFVKGEMPDCDTSKFVKSRRHGKGHSPGSYTGAQASFSSSVHKDSFYAQTQFATSDVFEVTQTEPLSFFDDESSAYAYLLHGKEEYKLLLSRGDLLKVKASAVVIPVDDRGNRGNIAGSLFSRIPEIYRKDYTFKLSSECHRKKECDVFITQGYECDYPFIVHAIYPANAKNKHISQRKHDVQKLYKNVFSLCDTKTGICEVVAPLLGPDIRSDSDIRACAEMFLQSYLDYYSRPVTKKSLLVHLVCREDLVYDCVKRVFDEYVMSKKAELNKTQEYMDISPSTQPVETPDNHEEENCVICMDTITDPETLKCGHTFCKDCIQAYFRVKEVCPTCGQVCGVITGDQPAGEMRCAVDRFTDCSGYNGHGRIAITYNFPSGRQGVWLSRSWLFGKS
ncbi:uncharacterized protein LOC132720174 isoform X2 [Ruditapes philippinarum]|uniref:uncharacterized protein LOC132720174 isoform X2 n=1 Tax=Ruditapes philippinarum TaxID=129788 RepID=UPI00295A7DE3|nr:uncharacterized protein LOC132720174 isoform X2 [Ruditapes philippinarum]